jgi:hypothetical protein
MNSSPSRIRAVRARSKYALQGFILRTGDFMLRDPFKRKHLLVEVHRAVDIGYGHADAVSAAVNNTERKVRRSMV